MAFLAGVKAVSSRGEVYLKHASQKSFVGEVESNMTANEVDDYILTANPDLYYRLITRWNQSISDPGVVQRGCGILSSPMPIPETVEGSNIDGLNARDSFMTRRFPRAELTTSHAVSPREFIPPTAHSNGEVLAEYLTPELEGSMTSYDPRQSTAHKEEQFLLRIKDKSKTRGSTEEEIFQRAGAAAGRSASTAAFSQDDWQRDLLVRNVRKHILDKLHQNHVFILQKVPSAEVEVRSNHCGSGMCTKGPISRGAYYLSLEPRINLSLDTPPTTKSQLSRSKVTRTCNCYCLVCVENIFSGAGMIDISSGRTIHSDKDGDITMSHGQDDGSSKSPFVGGTFTTRNVFMPSTFSSTHPTVSDVFGNDGAGDHESVSDGLEDHDALRIPEIGFSGRMTRSQSSLSASSQRAGGGPAHGAQPSDTLLTSIYPTNSPEEAARRAARAEEIESILHVLQTIQEGKDKPKPKEDHNQDSDDSDSGLKIFTLVDLPSPAELYRMKGYIRRDKIRDSVPKNEKKPATGRTPSSSWHDIDCAAEHYCYCREPDDGQPMILCSAEFCLVGWVHLKCSGLRKNPPESDTWYCKHCAAVFGQGTYVEEPDVADAQSDGDVPQLDSQNSTISCHEDDVSTPTFPPAEYRVCFDEDNNITRFTTPDPPSYQHTAEDSSLDYLNDPLDCPMDSLTPTPMNLDGACDSNTLEVQPLASITHLIYPETRISPFALSIPQQALLQNWKAKVAYNDLQISTPASTPKSSQCNRGIMEKNLHLRYPESPGMLHSHGAPLLGTMEIGGRVVELAPEEMVGKRLSQCLGMLDSRIDAELTEMANAGYYRPWPEGVEQREEWARIGEEKAQGPGEASEAGTRRSEES